MGCGSCRISEMDTQFFKSCRSNTVSIMDFDAYLTSEQRKYWMSEVVIQGAPQDDFWDQFNGFHHSCFTQIAKDINRTFPTLKFFSSKPNVERFQLLLKKFSIYFPKIGYTQGLNFIAGYLLMCGFSDESAFKILVGIMVHQNMLAIGLYEDQFPLNRLYCQVFWNLMETKMPKVAEKIRKANVPDQIWIFQWFISFFLYSFPTEYVKKWWNFNIWKKQMAMVLIALGIVKCLKADIMSLKNPDEFDFIQLFQNTKDLSFCQSKIDSKKMTTFINSFTFQQIQKAIESTKCYNNPYRKYFLTPPYERKQNYIKMMKHYKYERTCFKGNPDPRKYTRAKADANHLQDLMLSKYKLYQSQFKKSNLSNSMFKMSTFSISIENNGRVKDFNGGNKSIKDKDSSNPFSRGFLNNINFAQSKVLDGNSADIGNYGRTRVFSPNMKRGSKGISPFEQISERDTRQYNGRFNNTDKKMYSKEYPDFTKKSKPTYTNY